MITTMFPKAPILAFIIWLLGMSLDIARCLGNDLRCSSSTRTLNLLVLLPELEDVTTVADISETSRPPNVDDWPAHSTVSCAALNSVVERINANPEVLPCHRLELVCKDDGCGAGSQRFSTETSLVDGLFTGPRDLRTGSTEKKVVVGLLGPSCTASAIRVVYIASRPEISLVTVHNGGTSLLANSKNSVSILGSTRRLLDLSFALIEESGWKYVCVLYESSSVHFRRMKSEFLSALEHKGVEATVVTPLLNLYNPLNEIRSSRVRIVFIFASLKQTKKIMCLAYEMGLVYPMHQWVILGHTLADFENHSPHVHAFGNRYYSKSCTAEILLLSLENSFLINFQGNLPSTQPIQDPYGGITFDVMSNRTTAMRLADSYSDALRAWATVLHNLTADHPDLVFNNYGNSSLAGIIINQFFREGLSGTVGFDSSTGFANRWTYLYQVDKGMQNFVGMKNSTHVKLIENFQHSADRVLYVQQVHEALVGFFMALQCVELLAVIVLHILTHVYRYSNTVKANSPKLTHLAFIGAYIYIATLMINCVSWLDAYGSEIDAGLCQAIWGWGLPLSFTLSLGIVTVRTWRLYRIFLHYLDPGKLISNSALTITVLLLLSIDVAIAVVWTSADPMRFRFIERTVMQEGKVDVLLEPNCYYNIAWPVLIFSYKAALLLALIILTILTRNIPNRTFTTKSQQVFAYTFSIIAFLGFALYYIFTFIRRDPYAEFITLCTMLNAMLISVIVFIVIPPLSPVLCKKRTSKVSSIGP